MAQFVGVNKQQVYSRAYAKAQQDYKNAVNEYKNYIDDLSSQEQTSKFWGTVTLPWKVGYSVIKGGLEGAVNALSSVVYAGINFVSDIGHVFDGTDGTNAINDIGYAFGNLATSLVEGTGSFLIGTGAEIGRIFGADTDWAYGEDGWIPQLAQSANEARAWMLGQDQNTVLTNQDLFDIGRNYVGDPTGRKRDERNKEIIDARRQGDLFGGDSEDVINWVSGAQGWVKDNVVGNVTNYVTLGLSKTTDEAFANSEFYNQFMGSMESIGNILVSWGIAKIGSANGLNISQTQALSSLYFASTVAGGSMEEALNNGASIQDAYTYAIGNAFIETAIENIGGFTPSGEATSGFKKAIQDLFKSKWGGILSNALEEGLEEVIGTFGSSGLDYYKTPDNRITPRTNQEFFSEVLFSAFGGALSSVGLGIGSNLYIDTTLTGKTGQVQKDLQKNFVDATPERQQTILNSLNKHVERVVTELNKENAIGIKTNDQGASYHGKLTNDEKLTFLYTSGMNRYVDYNQEKGTFTQKEVTKDTFNNKIDGQTVASGEYAINDNVIGVELRNDTVKVNDLTETGKNLLELAQKRNVPIAIYQSNDGSSAYYDIDTGVVYVNEIQKENANLENIILRHEAIHMIAITNPTAYQNITERFENMINLEVDNETGDLTVSFKNAELNKFLQESGYFDDIVASYNDLKQAISGNNDAIVDILREEMLAYFVEKVFTGDARFLQLITKDNQVDLEAIANNKSVKDIAQGDKKLERQLTRLQRNINIAVKESIKLQATLGFLMNNVFGNETVARDFFKSDVIKNHDFLEFLEAWTKAMQDKKETFTIDGETYNVNDVIDENASINPKRLSRPDLGEIRSNLVYDESKKASYRYVLRLFYNDNIDTFVAIEDTRVRIEVRKSLDVIPTLLKQIEDGIYPFVAQDGFSSEVLEETFVNIVSQYEYNKSLASYKRAKESFNYNSEYIVANKAVGRVIRMMERNHPEWGKWSNNVLSKDYPSSATLLVVNSPDGDVDTIGNLYTNLIEDFLFDKYGDIYEVDYNDDGYNNVVIFVYPNDDYLKEATIAYENQLAINEISEDEKANALAIEKAKRLEAPQTVLKPFLDTTTEVLRVLGQDIESINIVDISAGLGTVMNALKARGIEVSQAYDFFRSEKSVEKVDIFETNIEYNPNSVIISSLPLADNSIAKYINRGLEIAPIVAVVVPSNWHNEYIKHKQINEIGKLAFSERLGEQDFSGEERKVAIQVWVNNEDSRFGNVIDLRLKKQTRYSQRDYQTIVLNRSEKRYNETKDFDFDFALINQHNKGFYNALLTDRSRMNPKGSYILVKAKDNATLQRLKSIDYELLAEYSKTTKNGFSLSDVNELYENIKKKEKDILKRRENVRFRKVSIQKQNALSKATFRELFPDGDRMSDFINIDKNGDISFKSEYIDNYKPISNAIINIDGKEYNSNEYAFHTHFDFSKGNLFSANYEKPVLLSSLTKSQKAVFNFFKTTKLNFVFYIEKSDVGGYSTPNLDASLTYININEIQGNNISQFIAETFLHEGLHEVLKWDNQNKNFELSPMLADFLFKIDANGNVTPTYIYKLLSERKNGDFIDYFNGYYNKYKKSYKKFNNHKQLYNFLKNISPDIAMYTKDYNTANELTAQIMGLMFSDTTVFESALKADNSIGVPMYNMFSFLMNSVHISPTQKAFLEQIKVKIDDIFNKYVDDISMFFEPIQKKGAYSEKELDVFINDFTNGVYKSKKDLLNAYLQERAKDVYDKASRTLDNIIYLSSTMANNMASASNVYTQLKNEFETFIEGMNYILANEDVALSLENKNIFTKYNALIDKVNQIAKKSKNVTIEMMDELIEVIRDFRQAYDSLDDTLLAVLGLPNRDTVNSLSIEVLNLVSQYLSGTNVAQDIVTNAKILIAELAGIKSLNTWSGISTQSVYMQIVELIRNARINQFNSIAELLKKRLSNRLTTITQNRPVTDRVNRVANIINDIIDSITPKPDKSLAKSDIINELRPFASALNNEIKTEIDKLTAQLNPDVMELSRLEQAKNHALNFYWQIASLLNDKKFVVDMGRELGFNVSEIENALLPRFKKGFLASSLANVLESFRPIYKTSLSNYQETHTTYADKTREQFLTLDKKDVNWTAMASVMPFQQFLRTYIEITGGSVDFLKDFEREWRASAKRRSDIFADFDRKYKAWQRNNKEALKNSLEKVSIDKGQLVKVSVSQLEKFKSEAKLEKERLVYEQNKAQTALQEVQSRFNVAKMNATRLRSAMLKEIKGTPEFFLAEQKLNEAEAKVSEISIDIINAEEEVKTTRADNRTFNITQEIEKRVLDNSDKEAINELTRGEIVNLYIATMREIEMHTTNNADIVATDHIGNGKTVDIFDNELLVRKGYTYATDNATKYLITSQDRDSLALYLEGLLNETDRKSMDFVREIFNDVYESADELFFKRYQRHMPKQEWYIHFASLNSSYEREMHFKEVNKRNIGANDSFTMETTLGANTPLKIENVFSVMQNMVYVVANYQFENLIKDYQNLVVNSTNGQELQSVLRGSNSNLGGNNNLIATINQAFIDVLGYTDLDEEKVSRVVKKALRHSTRAIISLNVAMGVKQLASISTISFKNRLNPLALSKNVGLAMFDRATYNWLRENNSNFYMRVLMGGNASLAEQITPRFLQSLDRGFERVSSVLGAHVNYFDAVVLVGAFKTIADKIAKANPQLTQNEVYERANVEFEQVLLFGVANTDSAFRAHFSNSKNALVRTIGRFMSENVLQVGGIIESYALVKNKIAGGFEKLAESFFALFFSALISAYIDRTFGDLRGYERAEHESFEFWINDVLWENMVGSIPYFNQLTQLLRWDLSNIVRLGYDFKAPLLSEITPMLQAVGQMANGKNVGRNALTILENAGQIVGVPFKNALRIVTTITNLFSNQGVETAVEMNRFFRKTTMTTDFNTAVRTGSMKKAEYYVDGVFESQAVRSEIMRIIGENPDLKLNFKLESTFTKDKVKYTISNDIQAKYKRLTNNALKVAISKGTYKRLSNEQKVNILQRIINYYYNLSKLEVTGEKSVNKTLSQVVDNAINLELKSLENAKKKG